MKNTLFIRTPSGLSGDMLVAGLAAVCDISVDDFGRLVELIGVAELVNSVSTVPKTVNGISGFGLKVNLPEEHSHRTWRDICTIIQSSEMSDGAKKLSESVFAYLATAEGRVHGLPDEDVTFHEVGALDSILDVCMAAQLLDFMEPIKVVCSPLPIGDGYVHCAHGILAVPAPAVQELLDGVPVYGIDARCETVTPTAIAFLKGCQAEYGIWSEMKVLKSVRAFGVRIIPGVPNGALFTLGG